MRSSWRTGATKRRKGPSDHEGVVEDRARTAQMEHDHALLGEVEHALVLEVAEHGGTIGNAIPMHQFAAGF